MKAAFYAGNRTFAIGESVAVKPGPGEVRIHVSYAGICGTDIHIFRGAMDRRVRIPQVIGHEMSGTIAEVGEGVGGLNVGDPVVVRPLDNRAETPADRGFSHVCQKLKFMGVDTDGAFQSSWTVPAFTVHKLPAGLDLKLGALVEPLAVACHDVKMGGLTAGELVVVIGGGPIGMLVALVARQVGGRVVIAEVDPFRLEFARGLGFAAINPQETDLAARLREQSGGSGADIVFEVSGSKAAALGMTELLAIRGRMVLVAIYSQPVEMNLFDFFKKELHLIGARVYEPDDYERAIAMTASGVLPLDRMITEVHPLDKLPEAFTRLDAKINAMKVLINCQA
jgi:2-desacetyl-2-hydroxyethyl bacteriochlorophyllide A dehydrogenase